MQSNKYKKIVVKIGTRVITSKDRMLDRPVVKDLTGQIAAVMNAGMEMIVVTSGAIGAGMSLVGMKKRPADLAGLQAAAAIGQSYLMHIYSESFREKGYNVGQMLLTQEDFNDRRRYLNIKNTINTLLKHRAVPIINENDTVATEEIKCGDNDRLSSLVADLSGADLLLILSDVDGLLDENGEVIKDIGEITPKILRLGGKSQCDLGTGGMAAKIEAAGTVVLSGIDCIIANGKAKDVLLRIALEGEGVGTIFKGKSMKLAARKRWIAFSSRPKGAIIVDDGAREALSKRGKSLLASGISSVDGNFISGDVVNVTDKEGKEFARGLVNYSSSEIAKINGLKTSQIKGALGHQGRDEVIHKDNLVIL